MWGDAVFGVVPGWGPVSIPSNQHKDSVSYQLGQSALEEERVHQGACRTPAGDQGRLPGGKGLCSDLKDAWE